MSTFQYISDAGAPLVVLVIFVLLMAVARPDRDSDGDGVYAVYLSGASLTALYTLLVFGAGLVQAVAEEFARASTATGIDSPFRFGSAPGDGSTAAIGALGTALVLAAIVYGFHTQRRRELQAIEGNETGASGRIGRAYLASVCFAMVMIVLRSALVAGVAAVEFIDTTDDHTRDIAAGTLIGNGLAALAAFLIFRSHFWAIRGTPDSVKGAATDAGDH